MKVFSCKNHAAKVRAEGSKVGAEACGVTDVISSTSDGHFTPTTAKLKLY